MPLLNFPNELLHAIADNLMIRDLSNLSRTNRHLNALLSPRISSYIVRDKDALLPWAAHGGYELLVRILLEKHADITTKDESGHTALEWATANLDESITLLLLKEGAKITSLRKCGKTALYSSVHHGNSHLARLLVEHGVPVDSLHHGGQTALHLAANCGFFEIIDVLLDLGAVISATDDAGCTALHTAVMSRYNCELVDEGCTALHRVATNGDSCELVVRKLLERGSDITARDSEGRTALHCAAFSGRKEVIMLLNDKGADITERDDYGETALHRAAAAGEGPTVEILLELRADIAARDCRKRTVLHTVAYSRYRPDAWKCGGWDGWKDTLKILLKSGAYTDAEDDEGRTAFNAALQEGSDDMAEILKEYDTERSSPRSGISRFFRRKNNNEDLQLGWFDCA